MNNKYKATKETFDSVISLYSKGNMSQESFFEVLESSVKRQRASELVKLMRGLTIGVDGVGVEVLLRRMDKAGFEL